MAQILTTPIGPKYQDFFTNLVRAQYEFENGLKYIDFYGEWGMIFVHYITPYLWVVPVSAALFLIVAFKKLHLFGPMQKCLVAIMVIDVFFVVLIGLKDAVFNVLKWNHGFIEFKICMFFLNFIHFQTAIYGTSLWFKSLMLIHRVLMFVFPFKVRYLNIKLFLVLFFFFHLLVILFYCVSVNAMPIKSFTTIQEYHPGMSLKLIDACIYENDEGFYVGNMYNAIRWFRLFVHIVYFALLPMCIQIICTIILIIMVRKQITKISFLTLIGRSKISKKVTYLVLIKVHIYLAVSFFVQESPISFSLISALIRRNLSTFQTANSTILIYVYQTFAIGKLIDLFLYISFSHKVKSELKNLIVCKNRRKEVVSN